MTSVSPFRSRETAPVAADSSALSGTASLSRYFSKPEKEIFNWAQEVIEAIRGGEIEGIIRLHKDGFCVEIGDHVKKTEIISTTR